MYRKLQQTADSINVDTSVTEHILVAKSSDEVNSLLKFTPDDKYVIHKRLVVLEFIASWCGLCAQVSLEFFYDFDSFSPMRMILYSPIFIEFDFYLDCTTNGRNW